MQSLVLFVGLSPYERLGFWVFISLVMYLTLPLLVTTSSIVKVLQPAGGAHSDSPLYHRTEVLYTSL